MESRNARRFVSATVVSIVLASSAAVFAATGAASANLKALSAIPTSVASWSAHVMQDGVEEGADCVYFINSKEGWAGGWKGRMYHTTDGGLTWKVSYLPNRSLHVKQVQFVSRLRGWALAEGEYRKGIYSWDDFRLYRTTDGGVTWKHVWTRRDARIEEFQFVNANRGWFVATGKVYTTSNGGSTLSDQHADKKITAPVKLTHLNGLRFVDAKRGWVSGGYLGGSTKSIMLRTGDGGRTWRQVKSGLSGSIEDVWFANGTTGYAIGMGLYKTTNGGTSWRRVRYSSKENYDAVQAFGASDVRVLGSAGSHAIWTSKDGGKSWKVVKPKVAGESDSGTAMSFINANTGWVVGGILSRGSAYALRTPAATEPVAPPNDVDE